MYKGTGVPPATLRTLPAALRRIAWAIGVTRVARLTALDRAGVEVATAVRPRGHVLQVSNGKGERWGDAALGAVLEAAELDAAEHPPPGDVPLSWVEGRELLRGGAALVPARAVYCPAPGERPLGGPAARWTSNGMGAHPDRAAALLHALLEAVERHQVARALPRFWTRGAVARRLLERASLARAAPRAARLAGRIERGGFRAFLFDLTGRRGARGDPGLPVAAALLFDERPGPVPVAAGYACGLDPDAALRAALLEAAQSRLTDIHGAREDVEAMDPGAAAQLRAFCEAARPRRRAEGMPRLRASGAPGAVRAVLARLRACGVRAAVACDLAPRGAGLHVVKVVVPGFRLSELL